MTAEKDETIDVLLARTRALVRELDVRLAEMAGKLARGGG